jgi:hypothetical protein
MMGGLAEIIAGAAKEDAARVAAGAAGAAGARDAGEGALVGARAGHTNRGWLALGRLLVQAALRAGCSMTEGRTHQHALSAHTNPTCPLLHGTLQAALPRHRTRPALVAHPHHLKIRSGPSEARCPRAADGKAPRMRGRGGQAQ